MRIGLVCPYDINKNGGVQEVVKALQAHYRALGNRAVIIAPKLKRPSGKLPKNTILLGIGGRVKALQTTSEISISIDPKELDQLLVKERFDILHFHEPWVPVLARQILTKSSAVNIATFHAKMPENFMTRSIEKAVTPYTKSILKNLHSLTAVSDSAADYIRSITDRKVEIIPNGIDLEKYQQPNIKHLTSNIHHPTAKTILFIGRLEKRKGVIYLLKAYGILKKKHPQVSLKIVGDGPDRRKLQKYVREHQIKDVEFLGFVPEKTKIELLHGADLFCSPALHGESFGIVLIEAMAAGTVTVAGNNPGYKSVLSGDGDISLVDPKNTGVFAGRLELLLYSADTRKKWTTWARKKVKQYDWHRVAAKYLELYLKTLK